MTLLVGHRGWPRRYAENSLAGLLAARGVCDMLEIDVRRTRDGVLILSHDPVLAGQPIHDTDWDALSRLAEPPPRLDEVLKAVGNFPLNFEIKQDHPDGRFAPDRALALGVVNRARPQDLVTSFHWPTMAAVREAYPPICTGLLVHRRQSLDEALAEALRRGHHALAVMDELLGEQPEKVLRPLLAAGLEVLVWTVNDPQRAVALAALGVVALISDDPPSLRAALAEPTSANR